MHWQLLTIVLAVAAPVPAEKEKKDEEKIQGTWSVVSSRQGGREILGDEVKKMKVTIKDDQVLIVIDDGQQPRKEEAKIRLDPEKKPKAVDFTPQEKEADGKEVQGIYELNGDDLKLCFDRGSGARPTEFRSKVGSAEVLIILKREKKNK